MKKTLCYLFSVLLLLLVLATCVGIVLIAYYYRISSDILDVLLYILMLSPVFISGCGLLFSPANYIKTLNKNDELRIASPYSKNAYTSKTVRILLLMAGLILILYSLFSLASIVQSWRYSYSYGESISFSILMFLGFITILLLTIQPVSNRENH